MAGNLWEAYCKNLKAGEKAGNAHFMRWFRNPKNKELIERANKLPAFFGKKIKGNSDGYSDDYSFDFEDIGVPVAGGPEATKAPARASEKQPETKPEGKKAPEKVRVEAQEQVSKPKVHEATVEPEQSTPMKPSWFTPKGEIKRNQITMVVGDSGTLKTQLMLYYLKTGLFFGQFQIKASHGILKALIVEGDTPKDEIKDEYLPYLGITSIKDFWVKPQIYYPLDEMIKRNHNDYRYLSTHGGMNAFQEIYGAIQPDIVIFDTILSLCENTQVKQARDLINTLRRTCISSSVFLMHHTNKKGDHLGAGAWRNLVDNVVNAYNVTPPEQENPVLVRFEKDTKTRSAFKRNFKKVEVSSLENSKSELYEITYDFGKKHDLTTKEGRRAKQIDTVLKENRAGIKATQTAKELGISRPQYYILLKEGVKVDSKFETKPDEGSKKKLLKLPEEEVQKNTSTFIPDLENQEEMKAFLRAELDAKKTIPQINKDLKELGKGTGRAKIKINRGTLKNFIEHPEWDLDIHEVDFGGSLNPLLGCTKFSEGCKYCYAERTADERFRKNHPEYDESINWTDDKVDFLNERLNLKASFSREAKENGIFMCSMADLFNKSVRDEDIIKIFGYMQLRSNLPWMICTKRAERLAEMAPRFYPWPANIWAGTTIEINKHCKRADYLRRVDTTNRFIFAEPLLGPLPDLDLTGIAHLLVGGESGNKALWSELRPLKKEWVIQLRDKCQQAGVSFFFKQWGHSDKCTDASIKNGIKHDFGGTLLDGKIYHNRPFAMPEPEIESGKDHVDELFKEPEEIIKIAALSNEEKLGLFDVWSKNLKTNSLHTPPEKEDGTRILVMRKWPHRDIKINFPDGRNEPVRHVIGQSGNGKIDDWKRELGVDEAILYFRKHHKVLWDKRVNGELTKDEQQIVNEFIAVHKEWYDSSSGYTSFPVEKLIADYMEQMKVGHAKISINAIAERIMKGEVITLLCYEFEDYNRFCHRHVLKRVILEKIAELAKIDLPDGIKVGHYLDDPNLWPDESKCENPKPEDRIPTGPDRIKTGLSTKKASSIRIEDYSLFPED